MATRSVLAAIVQAVIQLGQSLNLEIIAEGAETLEQVELLRAKGCMHVQGFYYSRPLPATLFGDFLRASSQAAGDSAAHAA